jgi:hypothetical protein
MYVCGTNKLAFSLSYIHNDTKLLVDVTDATKKYPKTNLELSCAR